MNSGNGGQQRRKPGSTPGAVTGGKDQTRLRIEKMEADREERRRAMQQRKVQRAAEEKANREAGNPGDVDFIGLVRQWRVAHAQDAKPLPSPEQQQQQQSNNTHRYHPALCICVRKRPVSDKERAKQDHDAVTVLHPTVWIHSAKLRVDGITKYLDHASFQLDYCFDETADTRRLYECTARPLLEFATQGTGGRATIFAYGQTGSGKTYTMSGIQNYLVHDLFQLLLEEQDVEDDKWCTLANCRVMISFFELYGGSIQDLLCQRQRLKILEDGKGEIVLHGLVEKEAESPQQLLELLQQGNDARTTHTTEANDASSRSHAICQVWLRDAANPKKLRGKLCLVDLAGSERGTDTKSHNAQRRAESADINTSLLALKECIRALDRRGGTAAGSKEAHVPYRGSKLTLLLKDCFTSPNAMTTMIATVSPGASATDHSLNTLRYADRIKEQKVGNNKRHSTTAAPTTAGMIRLLRQVGGGNKAPNDDDNEEDNMDEITRDEEAPPTPEPPIPSPPRRVRPTRQAVARRPAAPSPADAKTQDELELEETVKSLLAKEEEILGLHMSHIQANAELLADEGVMLQDVQHLMDDMNRHPGDNGQEDEQALDAYMEALESVLDRKEEMILNLQEKLGMFRADLVKETRLSLKVNGSTTTSGRMSQ